MHAGEDAAAGLPADVGDELAQTLTTLIRDVERFDSALRVERRRLQAVHSRPSVHALDRVSSETFSACKTQVMASMDEALNVLRRAAGPA